jgi:RNA-directed DNA polymerase
MTLDGIEAILDKQFGKKGDKKRKQCGVHLIRYADDFIITGKTKEVLENKVKPLIENFLRPRGLTLSAEKTVITHVEQGFDFLGQNVRKYNSSIIIKPAEKSIIRLLTRVRDLIQKNKASTQIELITMLNPQIRGWVYYHRHVCARKTFEKIDHEIFKLLWQWSKRRHPNKGIGWIKAKYFKSTNGQNWCFGTMMQDNGESKWFSLFKASSVPIRRHIKIRGEANPFDKTWYTYFEERQGKTTTSAYPKSPRLER